MSGSCDWQHLVTGGITSALISWAWRSEGKPIAENVSPRKVLDICLTVVRLFAEVWQAAWQVVPIVLARNVVVAPQLVSVKSILKSTRMRALYANCITLTPGTLTVHMEGEGILVHALSSEHASAVACWPFQEMLKTLEAR